MKRNLLTIMLAFFVVFGMNAQKNLLSLKPNGLNTDKPSNVIKMQTRPYVANRGNILDEGFETWPPAGWGLFQLADPPGWVTGTTAHTGSAAAFHNDDNATCEDWMVTPALAITSDQFYVKYWEYENWGSYYDLHRVVVFDGPDPETATELGELTAGVGTDDAWAEKTFSLAAYDGQTIYIGFYYQGVYADEWSIDDVQVGFLDPHDLGVDAIGPTFVESGGTVTPQVTVHNYGASDEATWSVQLTDGSGYDETVADAATIASGSDYVVDFPDWTPADGDYTLTATVTVTDDANTNNDEMNVDAKVMVTVLSYVTANNGVNAGTYNLPNPAWTDLGGDDLNAIKGASCIEGVWYALDSDGNLGIIDPTDGSWTLVGATGMGGAFRVGLAYDVVNEVFYSIALGTSGSYPNFSIELYSIDPATGAGTLIATSSTTGTLLTIACDYSGNLYGIMHVSGGNGVLYSMNTTDASLTAIGTDLGDVVSAYFQDMSFDYNTSTCYFQAYGAMAGTYEIDVTTGVATSIGGLSDVHIPGFAIPYPGVSVDELASKGISVYPNPSNGVFNINVDNNYNLEVFDITGRVINSRTLTGNSNIKLNNAGVYFLRFSNEKGSFTQKVIVQ